MSAFSCAAACSAWCRGTATGRAAGSQRASDAVEVKAGRARAVAGLQGGHGHVAGLLAAQPVLVLLDLAEDGDDGNEQPGALERRQHGAHGGPVLGPGGERRAQPGVGGAVVVGEAGVGNVLVRHGHRPYRGELLGLCGPETGGDGIHRFLSVA